MRLIDDFTLPLSIELFDRYSFFELYPFDGGGSFINREIIGAVDDAEYTKAVTVNNALEMFGTYKEVDFLKFESWRTIERTSWINRMYFIVPLANHARKTNDKKLAREVIDILLRFAQHPDYKAPGDRQATCDFHDEILRRRDAEYNAMGPDFDAKVPYQWFDFQPASRIIHSLHALYFVKDFDLISDEEWAILEEMIFIHGQNIYWGEESHIKLRPGNHQALRGMALMLSCSFFKGTRGTDKWIPVAEKMCDFHIREDFLADGMLNDLSPSYHFFECWISRDALIIAAKEGYTLSESAREKARKAFDICRALRQPDGFSTVVSDGYPLDMSIFIRTLGETEEKESVEMLLDEARIAVKKDSEGNYLLFDCSPLLAKLSHYHGGKQAVSVFFKGEAFLMDPGCCSYDDEDFSEYFKQSANHTSLLIGGKGDSVLQGLYTWLAAPDCKVSPWNNGVITSTMSSNAPGWEGAVWSRKVDFNSGRLELTDCVKLPREEELTFVFALRSGVECAVDGSKVLLTSGGVTVEALFPHPVEVVEGKEYKNFVKFPAKKLLMKFRSADCEIKTVLQVKE
ncbi:MAG: heparinase II/III family protein [Lentisphaeria bacterium]|nr:heparinase II/III family protein [Lentisphaeria bacterium]